MNPKIGEELIVIDDNLKGIVVSFNDDEVVLACDDGFDYEFKLHEVYRKGADGKTEHQKRKTTLSIPKKEKRKENLQSLIHFDVKNPVFDLHLEAFDTDKEFANDYDKLLFQLSCVREILRLANQKRVRKLVLIHGVGKGRLRNEIHTLLKQEYPSIEYLDGSYQKYGVGATELIIRKFQ